MLTDGIAAARTRAAKRTAPSGRGFYLEKEPLPKVLPGQGLGDGDDEVQSLVAEGPGDSLRAEEEAARLYAGSLSSPMLTPPAAVTVALDNRTAVFTPAYAPGALRGPTPLADDLRRDWELLEWANGRLVTRVRLLEAQLRAAGIEPAARE